MNRIRALWPAWAWASRMDTVWLSKPSTLFRYTVAVLMALLAELARLLLDQPSPIPYITYVPLIAVSAWFGGLGPGLLTTLLCALESMYFAGPPFRAGWLQLWLGPGRFAVAGLIVTALFEQRRRVLQVQTEAEEVRRQLTREVEARQTERIDNGQRFRALICNSPLAVIEWDAQHRVVSWAGSAPQIFGWNASEVVGKRVDEFRFVYEGDWDTVRAAMDAMEHGRNLASYNRNYRKDGAVIHCEWYNSVLDRNGAGGCGLSLVLDATEREDMAEALRASEEKYRHIFETAPIGIYHSTVEGRFLDVNSRLAEMFGYASPPELVNATQNIGEQLFVHPEMRDVIVRGAIGSDKFIPGEVEYRRWDGSILVCNLYLRAIREASGGIACLEGFVEDISERRHADKARREAYSALERVRERATKLAGANDSLEEADRQKTEFLASMSHELRTSLNSIIGFTSLLRQGLTGPVNAEQTKQLGIIQASGAHLLTLINDLLDVSRIEAGKADLEHKPFDFLDVLNETVQTLKPVVDRKALQVITEASAPTIPMTGDRKRTLQVLLNLANNAIKFTEKGHVKITAAVEDGTLRVAVADTGIGVKAEHIDTLFEPFRQVDGSDKRTNEGTGLGLYLCRNLLALMGGEIRVESVYGAGSCFTFTMPLELAVESPAS